MENETPKDVAVDEQMMQELEQENLEMDARVRPVVLAMYKAISEMPDMHVGITGTAKDKKSKTEAYRPVAEMIVDKMLEHHVRVDEVRYLFGAVLQPVEILKDAIEHRMAEFAKSATATMFGREQYEDVELNDVHNVLMGNYPKPYESSKN